MELSKNNDQQVITTGINKLAADLYKMLGTGGAIPELLYTSTDPVVLNCWNIAAVTYFNLMFKSTVGIQEYLVDVPMLAPTIN